MRRTLLYIICIIMVLMMSVSCAASNRRPDTAQLLDYGEECILKADYEQALMEFQGVIASDPEIPRGYTGAAQAYVGLGRVQDAINILEQGLELIGAEESIQAVLDELLGGDNGQSRALSLKRKYELLRKEDPDKDYLIEWVDASFEMLIRQALDKPGGDIWRSELENVRTLYIDGSSCTINASAFPGSDSKGQVECLYDIIHFDNLSYFRIVDNKVSDISPLESLGKLRKLDIWNNPIVDITPLSRMTRLEMLRLCAVNIENIAPLSSLTNLEILWTAENGISDVAPLSGLVQLTHLYLYENKISDVSALAGLTQLKHLELNENLISDLAPLTSLTNLTSLRLWHNKITDIKPLAQLKNLKDLSLGDNLIYDWSPVAHVQNVYGKPSEEP